MLLDMFVSHRGSRPYLLVVSLLTFCVALTCAKSGDHFIRREFTLRTDRGKRVSGVVVMPKGKNPSGTVVYLHGSGSRLMLNGRHLRQFAELGLAGVGIEYDQTAHSNFEDQFTELNRFLARQPWANTNGIAWVGYSLGAQYGLSYALNHPEVQPHIIVCLSGGWVRELDALPIASELNFNYEGEPTSSRFTTTSNQSPLNLKSKLVLIHGDNDEVFPKGDMERLAAVIQGKGGDINLIRLADMAHQYPKDHSLIIRLIAEYCKTSLAPRSPLVISSQNTAKVQIPFHMFFFMLTVILSLWFTSSSQPPSPGCWRKVKNIFKFLAPTVFALILAAFAFRFAVPHLNASKRTLKLAETFMVTSTEKSDFAYLSQNSFWHGRPLWILLEHARLANYNRKLVRWKLEEGVYRRYVLSPDIDSQLSDDCDWRRPLWENLFPRIRNESDPFSAALVTVRFLRERVSLCEPHFTSPGILNSWLNGETSSSGFERMYVAALRSVGIGARLNAQGTVEIWNGTHWILAPRPLAFQFSSKESTHSK